MRKIAVCLAVLFFSVSCSNDEVISEDKESMQYKIKKATDRFNLNNGWDEGDWAGAEPLELTLYMGDKPQHFPKTQAKVLYDSDNIYVFFRVEDRYVQSIAENFHDPVCRDSCVEFFFTPGQDISKGYFNMETNCGGVILFHHQIMKGEGIEKISKDDCEKITIFTSMPKIVEPEIQEPVTWTVKYAIPYAILAKYAKVDIPEKGVQWCGNFYKCADATSHPHWLTWTKVDKPVPDFHRPEYFGTLIFE